MKYLLLLMVLLGAVSQTACAPLVAGVVGGAVGAEAADDDDDD